MPGAVQRKARFAIVVLVNGRYSAGVADRARTDSPADDEYHSMSMYIQELHT